MSAPKVDVRGSCCDKPNINHMQAGATVNAVCIACGVHWYGPAKEVRRFTRKEWDAFLESGTSSDDSGAMPVVSMLDGFVAYLRDIDASVSERSLCSLRNAVAELIAADHEYDDSLREWDHSTAIDPEEISDETMLRIADRFERAVNRRAVALARIGGAA